MQPEERDAAHLWDMLEAARDATVIIAGLIARLEILLATKKS